MSDPMIEALNAWATATGVESVLHQGRVLNLFKLGEVPLWFEGPEGIWTTWDDLARIAGWTPTEAAEAWTIAETMERAVRITWPRDGQADGAINLVEGYAASIALASVGVHAEAVYAALAPLIHRALAQSSLADVVPAYEVELDADGQPVAIGPVTTLANLLGVPPSEEVAEHTLAQGVDAERQIGGRKFAIDLASLYGHGDPR